MDGRREDRKTREMRGGMEREKIRKNRRIAERKGEKRREERRRR